MTAADVDLGDLTAALAAWYLREARPLPWRDAAADGWAILVSEFMLQQTQVERVIPRYLEWMDRWPQPSSLAAAAPGDAVRAWHRLGYPRRALWLHRAATVIATEHDDRVPRDVPTLLSLPGVGPYTARAVASFAFGARHPVVDTNTRRVLARALFGLAAAGPPRPRDLADMEALLPSEPAAAQLVNAAAMELGAVICTARSPRCDACPIAGWCEWRGAGYPANAPAKRATPAAFEGSDRQARGRIMAMLRAVTGPIPRERVLAGLAALGPADPAQPERALASLLRDGLVLAESDRLRLP